jgi:nucleoside-diphosphate-sugar epimerase
MELVDVLSGIIDEQVTIDYRPLPQDDPVRRCPDISLARETLCWEPTISLVEGLRLSIDWYLNN